MSTEPRYFAVAVAADDVRYVRVDDVARDGYWDPKAGTSVLRGWVVDAFGRETQDGPPEIWFTTRDVRGELRMVLGALQPVAGVVASAGN